MIDNFEVCMITNVQFDTPAQLDGQSSLNLTRVIEISCIKLAT